MRASSGIFQAQGNVLVRVLSNPCPSYEESMPYGIFTDQLICGKFKHIILSRGDNYKSGITQDALPVRLHQFTIGQRHLNNR